MRLCADPERKTSREFRMSAEFSFCFTRDCTRCNFREMYGDTECESERRTGRRAHTEPVLKKSNSESENETWEKEKVFSNGFFKVSQSGSTMRTEVLAGITTFITIAYILILNRSESGFQVPRFRRSISV